MDGSSESGVTRRHIHRGSRPPATSGCFPGNSLARRTYECDRLVATCVGALSIAQATTDWVETGHWPTPTFFWYLFIPRSVKLIDRLFVR